MDENQEIDWVLRATNVGCVYQDPEATNEDDSDEQSDVNLKGIYVDRLLIPAGEITVIIGGSGSGKSTLLGLLTGLRQANAINPDASCIQYLARNEQIHDLLHEDRPAPGEMAFVFQESQLIKAIPTRMNAELGGQLSGAQAPGDVTQQLAESFGVDQQLGVISETLSGGQAQRIAVIRALAAGPNLIICDEPTSSLDDVNGDIVMKGIQDWAHQTGCAVLWVTHDLNQAARFADGVLLVAGGQVFCDPHTASSWKLSEWDDEKTEEVLNDLAAQGRSAARLTRDGMDGLLQDPHITGWEKEQARRTWLSPGRLVAGMRAWLFMIACAVAEISVYFRRSMLKGRSWLRSCLAGATGTVFRSLTQVLFLGLLVFYSVALGKTVTERALTVALTAPQMSHFTVAAQRNSQRTLDGQTIVEVNRDIQSRSVSDALEQDKALNVFGRIEDPVVQIWFPEETESGTCDDFPVDSPYSSSMQIFEQSEPLFSELKIAKIDGSARQLPVSDIVDPGLIVTDRFLEKYGRETLDKLCMDLFGPSEIHIAGSVPRLPGGGDRQYELGMLDQVHMDVFFEKRPAGYERDGRLYPPTFTNIAVYFQPENAEDVICAFEGVPGCVESEKAPLSGFKPDAGMLEQIRGLLGTLGGAQVAFAFLAAAFAATIAISTGLAVGAFVRQNEKSIAVMRAFGYSFFHVLTLLLTQIVFLLGISVLLFALAAFLFNIFGAPYLSASFSFPVAWLALHWGVFWQAFISLFVLSALVSVIVLGAWWRKNRYLGETLQAI